MCRSSFIILLAALLSSLAGAASAQLAQKRPVIIIPGVTGTSLVKSRTGRTAWFNVKRDRDDDMRLPMTSTNLRSNRDTLRPGDIIRKIEVPVLPDVEVYNALIESLEARGYREATWERPQAGDVFYVFPYDWRRDNVETAQLLMGRITAAKRVLGRADLKFDILAHSMGGLIARYAAMYGAADLPRRTTSPTWAGAQHINKLMMFGTPNEGTFSALESLLEGYPIVAGRKLPFVDDPRAEDVMSSPAIFQLLPHRGSARFVDEDLKPISVDLYDPATWAKYRWGALHDPKFLSKLRDARVLARKNPEIKPAKLDKDANADDRILARTTSAQVRAYFTTVLDRAKRFHNAINAAVETVPIQIYAYGGNCEPTTSAVVLMHDEKKDRWLTIFEAKDLKTADGRTIKKDDVKSVVYSLGDGRVTQRSLLTVDNIETTGGGLFTLKSSLLGCGTHTKLFLEKPIQDSFLSALIVEKQQQP